MAVVGSAEVIVRAITSKIKADISKAFRDARPAVKAEGKAAADDYLKGFRENFSKGLGDSVKTGFNSPALGQAAAESGKNTGGTFRSSMEGELGRVDVASPLRDATRDAAAMVTAEARAGAQKASSAFEREMGAGGRRGGNAFGRGFLNSGFADAAVSASKKFTILLATSNLLGPAIGGLVGVISSAVSGLYAMASAASVAAGALVVLPGALSVAAQAMGALKLAFSGVGTAVSAGFKGAAPAVKATGTAARDAQAAVADAAKALGRAQQDAARQVSAARQALSRAYRDSAQAAADSSRKVADALDEERDANRDLLDAQRELNFARKEAIEQLQQLAFSAEDAALGEERAGLRLEDAHAALVAAQSLPVDDRARREAELGYKEAELAFREAKDRNSDTAKEAKKAAKAGVDGTDVVVSAREKVADAEEKVHDAIVNTSDARRDQQRQAVQSAEAIQAAQQALSQAQLSGARSVADAQDALAKAHQRVADAAAGGAAAIDAYGDAMDKLSKPARAFVKYLVSLQDEFRGLKAAAGEELFPKLTVALKEIVTNIFPILENSLRRTGGLLGEMAVDFAHTISTGEGFENLKKIFKGNNDILAIFTKENKKGKSAIDSLAIVITRLLVAIQPLTERFARWIASLIRGADVATNTGKKMGKLGDFFDKAGDRAALLGDIVGNIFGILINLGKAADPAGVGLLESFRKATGGLEKFLGKKKQQDALKKFFEGVATNMRAIGRLINAVAKEFLALGDNKGIGELADGLIPAVRNFGDIGDSLTEAGPALAGFAESASELIKNLTNSGQIEHFIKNLTWVMDRINDIVGSDTGQKVLGAAAWFAGFTRVAALLVLGLGFVYKAIIGGPIAAFRKIISWGGKVTGGLGKIRSAFGLIRKGKFGDAFRGIKGGSDAAKLALEKQMVTDKKKVGSLAALEVQADKTALALLRVKEAGLPGAAGAAGATAAAPAAAGAKAASGAAAAPALAGAGKGAAGAAAGATKATGKFSKMGGIMGKLAKGPFKLLGKSFMLMGRGLLAILGPIGLVIVAGFLLFKFFQALYKRSPEFRKFVDGIVGKLKDLGKWFGKIFNEYVVPAMDAFFKWVNENLPKLKPIFAAVFAGIGNVIGVGIKVFKTIITVIGNVIGFVKDHWKLLLAIIGGPLVAIAILIASNIGRIKKFFNGLFIKIRNVVNTIKKKIGEFVGSVRNLTERIGAFIGRMKKAWEALKNKIHDVIVKFIQKRIENFKRNMSLLRERVGSVINVIKTKFDQVKNKIHDVIINFIRKRIDTFKNNMQLLKEKVREVIDNVKEKWNQLKTKISDIVTIVGKKITDIKNKFGEIKTAVANAFSGLGGKAKEGINKFIDFLNKNLIGKINTVTSKFGMKIPKIERLAEGGPIKGQGGPTEDNHLRRLSAGEYVVKSKSVRAIGERNMDYLNRYGRVPSGMKMGWPHFGLPDAPNFHLPNLHKIADLFKAGVGKTLAALVNRAKSLLKGAGIEKGSKSNPNMNNFLYGIMDKLSAKARAWGHAKDEQHAREVAAAAAAANSGGGSGAAAVWRALTSSGFNKIHTAGIMGNMQSESGFDPYIIQGGGHSQNPAAAGGGGYGLVQWTPGSKLIPYLHGRKPTIDAQIDALRAQLAGKGPSAEGAAGARLRRSKTIGAATIAFELGYERHAGGPQPHRISQAHHWFDMFHSGGASQSGDAGDAGSAGGSAGRTTWRGGTFTHRFVNNLIKAQKIAGVQIHVTQGGFRPQTSYSGTSHQGDALDTQVSASLIRALRSVGIAAGDRTGLGNWGGHVHAIPGPNAGYRAGSAVWQWFDYLRRGGRRQSLRSPWGLAQGGIVPATPGGILAMIGEGGRNERVEPLSRDGLSARDRAMIDLIRTTLAQGGGGGGGDIHVYPSRGMNEIELANLVSRRIAWKKRPGT